MDIKTFEAYRREPDFSARIPVIAAADLVDPDQDRTLTFGRDGEGTWCHVYLLAGEIHVMRARGPEATEPEHASATGLPVTLLRPTKRAMPEHTDAHFARMMRDLGYPLTFTTWAEPRYLPFECRRHDRLLDYTQHLLP